MKGPGARAVLVLVATIAITACGADSAALPSAPAGASPGGSASPVASPTPGDGSVAPASTAALPAVDPTPEPLVIGGRWLRPEAGAKLTSSTVTLAAKVTSTGDGTTTIDKVVFSARWPDAAKAVACKATRPTDAGAWRCKADLLKLGVPPGKVTFSFDVYPVGVPIARSPDGPLRATYAVKPPKPTDPRWKLLSSREREDGGFTETYRLRWSAPAGYADEFLVYDTWECPRDSDPKNVGTPCFVAGTSVDVSELRLIGKAPGDARALEVRLVAGECGPSYSTILMRARNAFGNSGFTVVDVMAVPDPNDIIC